MDNFQSITKAIESIKRPMIAFSVIGLVIYVAIGLILVDIAKGNNEKDFSTMETCFYGMESIFNNDPSETLLNKTILKDLKKNQAQFEVSGIHLIKVINHFECDVFSKDKKGVRRFLVKLEKNTKFKHLYKVLDISERKVDSRYQI